CGKPMVIKYGRFGRFLACSGYPECTFTKPYQEKTGALCPKCGHDLVVRHSRRGRTFYGCAHYPECDFVSWYRPTEHICPQCGANMALHKKGKQQILVCLRPECGYEQAVEESSAREEA
ncbi:MAG: topoisomerase DNA-binding C4 zinc finger domain-containing protein, partial [Firmicutes bacterium]|nr:topoisomerase DNA-binding C4 zinc finger domain-containing protein [Bacillota bacterium]